MVIEPDNKFMPISHTHLTKYLSGIVGGKTNSTHTIHLHMMPGQGH